MTLKQYLCTVPVLSQDQINKHEPHEFISITECSGSSYANTEVSNTEQVNVEHYGLSVSKVAMHRRGIVVALSSRLSVAVLSLSICWYCSSIVSLLDTLA